MDDRVADHLSKTNMTNYFWQGNSRAESESTRFRSRAFNVIVNRKKSATLAVMELGYNIIFADTDVVIVRDPIEYLVWKNVDYAHSVNKYCPMYV